jgi:uncharacterized membrane protein required for colicin V production
MGLDLALGGLVLLAAIRGWFRGFVLQAIRLSGLVGCVYAADPIRDQIKPRVLTYLSAMRPEIIDRLLWWTSAVLAYVVLVGLGSLIVKLYRQQPFGLAEPNRGDQFGGLVLGAAKGFLITAFVLAGVQKYALGYLKSVPQIQELTADSRALDLEIRFHPADQFWAFPPVQLFVARVQRGGLNGPAIVPAGATEALKTASRTPRLQWSAEGQPPIESKGIDPEVAEAVRESLRKGGVGN